MSFIWRRSYIREEVETDFEKRSCSCNHFSNDCLPSSVILVDFRFDTHKKKKEFPIRRRELAQHRFVAQLGLKVCNEDRNEDQSAVANYSQAGKK